MVKLSICRIVEWWSFRIVDSWDDGMDDPEIKEASRMMAQVKLLPGKLSILKDFVAVLDLYSCIFYTPYTSDVDVNGKRSSINC